MFAQTLDSSQTEIRDTLYMSEEVHIGIGLQKGIFAGLKLHLGGFIAGSDIGYYPFSKDYSYTMSMTLGWLPEYSRTHPGIFYSLVITPLDIFKKQNIKTSFLTANIGWLSLNKKDINYAFSLGAGIKSVTTSPITNSFFINVEASIGYSFF